MLTRIIKKTKKKVKLFILRETDYFERDKLRSVFDLRI